MSGLLCLVVIVMLASPLVSVNARTWWSDEPLELHAEHGDYQRIFRLTMLWN